MNIYWGLTLDSKSNLYMVIGGRQAGTTFSQIVNLDGNGPNIQLGGTLRLAFANGFQSQVTSSDVFTLISGSTALGGQFTNVASGNRLQTTDGSGSFLVNYSGTNLTISAFVPTPRSPLTFSQWEAKYPNLTDPLPNDIPEHDGITTLLKYLSNINPSQAMSATDKAALPTVGIDTTTIPGIPYLSLTYRQYASETGITINVQTSTDLETWTTVTPDISQQVGTEATTQDPIMEVGVKMNGVPKLFIRLNVTMP